MKANPDNMLHAFRTPFGLPPDMNDVPVCGAKLTKAYDFQQNERPSCPKCLKLMGKALNKTFKV